MPKSDGQPGPGDSTTRSGRDLVDHRLREAVAQRDDLGALLAEVVGQGVDEGVLVVDEQHLHALARPLRGRRLGRGTASCGRADRGQRAEQGAGLELGLALLGLRVGVVQQRGAGPDAWRRRR